MHPPARRPWAGRTQLGKGALHHRPVWGFQLRLRRVGASSLTVTTHRWDPCAAPGPGNGDEARVPRDFFLGGGVEGVLGRFLQSRRSQWSRQTAAGSAGLSIWESPPGEGGGGARPPKDKGEGALGKHRGAAPRGPPLPPPSRALARWVRNEEKGEAGRWGRRPVLAALDVPGRGGEWRQVFGFFKLMFVRVVFTDV